MDYKWLIKLNALLIYVKLKTIVSIKGQWKNGKVAYNIHLTS